MMFGELARRQSRATTFEFTTITHTLVFAVLTLSCDVGVSPGVDARKQGATAATIACAQSIVAGNDFTCVVTIKGGLRCWGSALAPIDRDGCGICDDRCCADADCCGKPPDSDALSNIRTIVTAPREGDAAHICALMTNESIRCWGTNDFGQLGDGTTQYRRVNEVSDSLTDVRAVSVGGAFTCALMNSGGVRCWGNNYAGQLGDGTTVNRSTPPDVDALVDVQAIATGAAHACALTTSGGVRCWGRNVEGQLGDGTTTELLSPPDVDILSGVKAIAANGARTCAIMAGGGLRCWGGASGLNGFTTDGTVGTAVPDSDFLANVKQVAMADSHWCVLFDDGGVKCWGQNSYGQLGDGSTSFLASPPDSDVVTSAVAVAVGENGHSCALLATGQVSCWGRDDSGQVGDLHDTVESIYCNGGVRCQRHPTPVQSVCE
jgi:alpha-tubulin suppressor-like RCC1 family protein